jgi:hypothetical protein
MPLKSYKELAEIDISKYTETRKDGGKELQYLNWAKCVQLLHEHGAEKVYFEPIRSESGSSLFMADQVFTDSKGGTNRCYEVGVRVFVDDNEWGFFGPLMNGANPVKDNSLSQQRVWNCQTRLFVKCVAVHTGLGFQLWLKEENENNKIHDYEDDLSRHDIMAIKTRVEQLVTIKMDTGLSLDDIGKPFGMDADAVRAKFSQYKELARFEQGIAAL